jgi:hypothetical protein
MSCPIVRMSDSAFEVQSRPENGTLPTDRSLETEMAAFAKPTIVGIRAAVEGSDGS